MSDKTRDGSSRPPSPEDERIPFEKFKEMLRKVVAVPKAEIDKRRRGT